ncbi:MAG: 3-hydroxyacyl-CoA dehydrogenase NAD-binding domain-containing protein [Pseudomonadota bacterium]
MAGPVSFGPVSLERVERDGCTVGLIWIDNAPVNALSHAVRSGIVAALERAEQDCAAIVLAGRSGTFIAGADIKEFGKPLQEPILFQVCDRIEASTVPVVAAVEGNTLGGGLETALGCHFRVAHPEARVGLPEVNLGLLPGAGGTQRPVRLLKDPLDALTLATSGKPVTGQQAFDMGLVDAVAEDTVDEAIAFAASKAGTDFENRRLSTITLSIDNALAARFEAAMAAVEERARGAMAPVEAAKAVRLAFDLPFVAGIQHERETFKQLVASDQSKALRHIFFAERQGAKAPSDVSGTARPVSTIGIIGAGTMGGGIAMTMADAGLAVRLLDASQEGLDAGLTKMRSNWERGLKSGRINPSQIDERMGRVQPTTDYADLGDCDLIIEAVFETMAIKKQVFAKLDAAAKPGAVLATNTSYLDVNEIAAATSRPQDVVGMHYFSPANIMKLLEVVRAEETGDDALMTALSVAKRTGKTAVIAGVGHGFIGNRLLTPYLRQAYLLVLEGATPEQVDRALTRWGMAMGPFSVNDLAGLDIGYKSRLEQNLEPHETALYAAANGLVEAGHVGQKAGQGFYVYDPNTRAKTPNPLALTLVDKARADQGYTPRPVSDDEIVERCIFALANEGAHVLAEGVAQRASNIDVVYVHGYGFPRWRGGPMHYAQAVGLTHVAQRLSQWSRREQALHWTPSDLLMERASSGEPL